MLLLPALAALYSSVVQMIPFARYAPPPGIFDLMSLTKLYFMMCLVHGVRIGRRMLHPELEMHSRYEGPALPFFSLIPKSQSFYFTRIVLEPCRLVNKAKVEPKTVQGILRHSRIQTTLDLYTQEDSDEARAAQGQFLEALGMQTELVQ
jgi:hypothetical protein